MTKAELLVAIATAPDDAVVFIDPGDGILRSRVQIDVEEIEPGKWEILLAFAEVT